MESDSAKLRRGLKAAGLSDQVIRAAWPSWWSEELASSPSGRAELRFALARKLGLAPASLLGERVEFIWNEEAKFKHLSAENEVDKAALTSFGIVVGRLLLRATKRGGGLTGYSAPDLRDAILTSQQFVDLPSLIVLCWGVGIPVIHLRVFPLPSKSMHAMVVNVGGRNAILLGKDASYPAPVAFTLAHEIGHLALDHLSGSPALIDLKDPATSTDPDAQEREADEFALGLLTGQAIPNIITSSVKYNAPTLARAAMDAGRARRIDPGILSLCLAHRTGSWPLAMSSLRFIYSAAEPVWRIVNSYAISQLDWNDISDESASYLQSVMGYHDL